MIADATVADARGIAGVQVRAWRAAYRGFLPHQLLEDMSVGLRETAWQEILAGKRSPGFTVVAKDDDVIAGFCSIVIPSRDDGAGDRTAEVAATYVDPPRWGSGVGRSLLSPALDRLRDGRWDDTTLWTFLRNAQGRAFYARHGFRLDGEKGVHEASGVATARMRVALAAPPP